MNLKEVQRVVHSVQSNLFKNAQSFSSGVIKSHFKGSGLQFREHQVYVPGDDIRFIDWKLSARTPNVYIKTFEEERNVEIYTFLDLTPDLFNGDNGVSKLQAIIETIAMMYLLADKSQDLIRVHFIGLHKEVILPLQRGQSGLVLFISTLKKHGVLNSKGEVNLKIENELVVKTGKEKIKSLRGAIKKNREVVYFGSLSGISMNQDIKNLFSKRNFHIFRYISNLDLSQKSPFFMKVRGLKKNAWSSLRSEEQKELDRLPRVKSINVSGKYLESFVRGMI